MKIRVDNLNGLEICALLREHLQGMARLSPPESVHALGLEALKELDARHGEIKSMRTVAAHQRKGVAAALVHHILEEAKRRSYRRLSLETGSMAAFAPARSLYARFEFHPCAPFADYIDDPNSVFMTREL